jgi:hypothetical protein
MKMNPRGPILVLLQNAYMPTPEKAAVMERLRLHNPERYYRTYVTFTYSTVTGRRLFPVLSSNLAYWRNREWLRFADTSPGWGVGSGSKLGYDADHVRRDLEDSNPRVILACGSAAAAAAGSVGWYGRIIITPHPAYRLHPDRWAGWEVVNELLNSSRPEVVEVRPRGSASRPFWTKDQEQEVTVNVSPVPVRPTRPFLVAEASA